MMFGDMSQQFGGGALRPDYHQTAVLALSLSRTELIEIFPSSAAVLSERHYSSGRAEKYFLSQNFTKYKMWRYV